MSEESQVSEQIQQLEDARFAAMVGKDVATLDRLLDDKLIYMHSTGISDTKSSYLEGLRTGVWDYQSVDRADQRIQADGDVVLVFCKMSIRLISRGVVRAFDSRALAVWVRKADGWRLLAVQSGAIPNAS
ncbi:MAG: nuclear transport factor 2 family protein [Paraburkholderia sp.]